MSPRGPLSATQEALPTQVVTREVALLHAYGWVPSYPLLFPLSPASQRSPQKSGRALTRDRKAGCWESKSSRPCAGGSFGGSLGGTPRPQVRSPHQGTDNQRMHQ